MPIFFEIFQRFRDATNPMLGTSYITSNVYFERIALLYRYLKDAVKVLDPKVKAMDAKIKEKFDKYNESLKKVCYCLAFILFD